MRRVAWLMVFAIGGCAVDSVGDPTLWVAEVDTGVIRSTSGPESLASSDAGGDTAPPTPVPDDTAQPDASPFKIAHDPDHAPTDCECDSPLYRPCCWSWQNLSGACGCYYVESTPATCGAAFSTGGSCAPIPLDEVDAGAR